jgi:hypothetical protein
MAGERLTSVVVVHFKNFMGPGALCGAPVPPEFGAAAGETVTLVPDKVTCPRCLARMGRKPPPVSGP